MEIVCILERTAQHEVSDPAEIRFDRNNVTNDPGARRSIVKKGHSQLALDIVSVINDDLPRPVQNVLRQRIKPRM